jgi:SAM-dependent methyltransferase
MTDHASKNRAVWDAKAHEWVEGGRRGWTSTRDTWGMWNIPERELKILPPVEGRDVIDLGCGTGYWSAAFARRGARVVALDNSSQQLATAQTLQDEFKLHFPLVHADAEHPPFRSGSFDVAFSEYGASIWCDPYKWIPEAARLLRPGGELVFLRNSVLFSMCAPDSEDPAGKELLRGYHDLHRLEWTDDGSVNFSLPTGKLIRLFHQTGFEILDCAEPQAPPDATRRFYVDGAWAHQWPSEEIWRVRKRS